MPHKIIKAGEVRETIKSFLQDEKNRTTKIALLNLEEVTVYIKTAQSMQKECEQISHYFEKISSRLLANRSQGRDDYWWRVPVVFMGYTCSVTRGYDRERDDFRVNVVIEPTLPFEALANLLSELEQQKDHLMELHFAKNKLQEKVNLNASHTKSLDKQESKMSEESLIESTMSDAENQFALKAIDSYHALVNQTREVFDKLKTLKNQETLLEATLAQNEKLQHDQKILQSQFEIVAKENKQSGEAAAVAQRQVLEQKAELNLLKQHEPSMTEIKRQSLVDLLDTFGYKAGFSLFSSEETIERLKNITKSNKEFISIEQIKSCITDGEALNIFNYPYSSPQIISKTGLLIRELALLYRKPLPQSPCVSHSN